MLWKATQLTADMWLAAHCFPSQETVQTLAKFLENTISI